MSNLQERIAQLASTAFASNVSNDQRHQAIEALTLLVEGPRQVNGQELSTACVNLMSSATLDVTIRSYAGNMLARAVQLSHVTAVNVPYNDILQFVVSSESTLPQVIIVSFSKVIIACAMFVWPTGWPNLLNVICPEDLYSSPVMLHCLEQFCEMCIQPPRNALQNSRIGELKRAFAGDSAQIASRLINCLYKFYVAGQNGNISAQSLSTGMRCLAQLIVVLPPDSYWQLNLDGTLVALLSFPPSAAEAATCVSELIASDKLVTTDARSANFIQMALGNVETLIAQQQWGAVQDLLDAALHISSSNRLQAYPGTVKDAVLLFLGILFNLPSIVFVQSAIQVFLCLADSSFKSFVPQTILSSMRVLCAKPNVHPTLNHTPASEFSRNQLSTVEAFDLAYSEFRKSAAQLLVWIGSNYPSDSAQFILSLIQGLQQPNPDDQRTQFGHVTQNTKTFALWSSALFVIDGLAGEAFRRTNNYVQEAFDALMQALVKPSDATLAPLYLNIMSAFWATSIPHWGASLDTLFGYMVLSCTSIREFNYSDLDLCSARKRAHTLFVRACVNHGPQLLPLLQQFLSKIQQMIISDSVTQVEKGLLYEAVAALSNGMVAEEQGNFLSTIIGPTRQSLQEMSNELNAARIAQIITGDTRDLRNARSTLKESVTILSAILRRCNPSPYMAALAQLLLPLFGDLAIALHHLPDVLPPQFQGILDLDENEKEQFQTGGMKRSLSNMRHNSPMHKARSTLHNLRTALYQGVGTLPKFLDVNAFMSGLTSLLETAGALHIHSMRLLCEQCLFPICISSPTLVPKLLPSIAAFFNYHSGKSRTAAEDAADSRQLFYFVKDVAKLVESGVLEHKLHQTDSSVLLVFYQLLDALLRNGNNMRNTARVIFNIMPAVPAQDCLTLFSGLMNQVLHNVKVREPERDQLLNMLCDWYLKNFPNYQPALQSAGLSTNAIEELHRAFAAAPRVDVRRRRFREHLRAAFQLPPTTT